MSDEQDAVDLQQKAMEELMKSEELKKVADKMKDVNLDGLENK